MSNSPAFHNISQPINRIKLIKICPASKFFYLCPSHHKNLNHLTFFILSVSQSLNRPNIIQSFITKRNHQY